MDDNRPESRPDARPDLRHDPQRAPLAGTPFGAVPIECLVAVGRARPTIGELLSMGPEAVLLLDRAVDDPVDLYIGDRLVARGHLEEAEPPGSGQLAVRLTEIVERIDRP